jgi:hypothetical protein
MVARRSSAIPVPPSALGVNPEGVKANQLTISGVRVTSLNQMA